MVNKKDIEDLKEWISERFNLHEDKLESKIDELNEKYENILKETQETRERQDARISEIEAKNDSLNFELSTHDNALKSLQEKHAQCESKILTLEAQILKDNLRFHGLKSDGNSSVECVKNFLEHSLKIPSETVANIDIVRCYRVGKPDTSRQTDSRTILAKFLRSDDVSMIMAAARKKPKGTPGGVQEDLPPTWAKKRQELHQKFVVPARQQLGADKVKFKWQQDSLYINQVMVDPNISWESLKTKLQGKQ